MLDNLLSLYRKSSSTAQPYLHVGNILANIEQIAKCVGSEYLANGDLKNAAIDEIVAILKAHKD